MINVADVEMKYDDLKLKYAGGSIERKILEKMADSDKENRYSSMEELDFEIEFRKRIIEASSALYRGGLRFSTFRKSECNEDFWERMENGGFKLKDGIKPSEGLRDIFRRTRKYATECATAIVIIFYKAVYDIYKDELFNTTFPDIILMNWLYTDNKLDISTDRNPGIYLPGDCRYFKNPDVDPMTPEWQGENAIDMGGGAYYGHGIGITSKEMIIRILNKNRIKGSEISAYLTDSVTLPDFKELFRIYNSASTPVISELQAHRRHRKGTRRPF